MFPDEIVISRAGQGCANAPPDGPADAPADPRAVGGAHEALHLRANAGPQRRADPAPDDPGADAPDARAEPGPNLCFFFFLIPSWNGFCSNSDSFF